MKKSVRGAIRGQAGDVCVCASDNGTGLRFLTNVCVSANCHVDSDCGPSEYCSPSRGYCGAVGGFYCHTSQDTCVDPTTDCHCGVPWPAPTPNACVYAPAAGHFVCGSSVCNG